MLVLNKLDRLITEVQLSPEEAYEHLQRILEQVNVIASALFTADLMAAAGGDTKAADAASETSKPGAAGVYDDWKFDLDERKEASIFFEPSKGNVVFASAMDGWAFGLDQFAELHSERLNIPARVLRKALWGNYTYKTKVSTLFLRLMRERRRFSIDRASGASRGFDSASPRWPGWSLPNNFLINADMF